jgi:hypothetical protein
MCEEEGTMWKKSTAWLLILPLMSMLLSPGCATLTRRSTQRIPVTSSPAGATVFVNGVKQGVAPVDLRLARKDKGQVIRIEYPGYNPLEVRMRRSFSTVHAMANGLMGALSGYLIAGLIYMTHDETANGGTLVLTWVPASIGAFFLTDLSTSAGYTLRPYDLIVTLSKADGPPRVDTMLVDAEDFKNVRWIRVHKD